MENKVKTQILMLPAVILMIAGCQPTTTSQTATTGALTGAALGAAVADDDERIEGALIGGTVGAIAGTLIGQSSTPGNCVYRDAYNRQFIARCP
jgi:di/tricarboxylate transporter